MWLAQSIGPVLSTAIPVRTQSVLGGEGTPYVCSQIGPLLIPLSVEIAVTISVMGSFTSRVFTGPRLVLPGADGGVHVTSESFSLPMHLAKPRTVMRSFTPIYVANGICAANGGQGLVIEGFPVTLPLIMPGTKVLCVNVFFAILNRTNLGLILVCILGVLHSNPSLSYKSSGLPKTAIQNQTLLDSLTKTPL